MDAVDIYIQTPERENDKPFLIAVEDVHSITGRGTVATGRVERGMVKVGENIELIGLTNTKITTVTGLEIFQKTLEERFPGDNLGVSSCCLHCYIILSFSLVLKLFHVWRKKYSSAELEWKRLASCR